MNQIHFLCKKIDALEARDDNEYAEMYDRVFAKLDAIWHMKESRLSAEIFERITGRKLIRIGELYSFFSFCQSVIDRK